jgi:hypothetical protein
MFFGSCLYLRCAITSPWKNILKNPKLDSHVIPNAPFVLVSALMQLLLSGILFLCHFFQPKNSSLAQLLLLNLINFLGDNKSKVFTTPGYKLNQGVVHALVLKLMALCIKADLLPA